MAPLFSGQSHSLSFLIVYHNTSLPGGKDTPEIQLKLSAFIEIDDDDDQFTANAPLMCPHFQFLESFFFFLLFFFLFLFFSFLSFFLSFFFLHGPLFWQKFDLDLDQIFFNFSLPRPSFFPENPLFRPPFGNTVYSTHTHQKKFWLLPPPVTPSS